MKKVIMLVLFILCAYLVVAQNMSAGQNIKAQITSKNYTNNAGQKIQIQKQSENQIQLKVKNVISCKIIKWEKCRNKNYARHSF